MIQQTIKAKPIETGDSYGLLHHCSNCDFPKNESLTQEMKHCWNCGIELDWSEWESGEACHTDKLADIKNFIMANLKLGDKVSLPEFSRRVMFYNGFNNGYRQALEEILSIIERG